MSFLLLLSCHGSVRCSTDHTKRSFHRAATPASAIFAKRGHFTSEEVILELSFFKVYQSFNYGLELCALIKSRSGSRGKYLGERAAMQEKVTTFLVVALKTQATLVNKQLRPSKNAPV